MTVKVRFVRGACQTSEKRNRNKAQKSALERFFYHISNHIIVFCNWWIFIYLYYWIVLLLFISLIWSDDVINLKYRPRLDPRHYFDIGRGGDIILNFHYWIPFLGRLGQPVEFHNFPRIKNYNSNITRAPTYTGSQIVCNSPTSTKSIGRSYLSFALDSKKEFQTAISSSLPFFYSSPNQTPRKSQKVLELPSWDLTYSCNPFTSCKLCCCSSRCKCYSSTELTDLRFRWFKLFAAETCSPKCIFGTTKRNPTPPSPPVNGLGRFFDSKIYGSFARVLRNKWWYDMIHDTYDSMINDNDFNCHMSATLCHVSSVNQSWVSQLTSFGSVSCQHELWNMFSGARNRSSCATTPIDSFNHQGCFGSMDAFGSF